MADVPTQFPTQGQWWSNLAMQRLHTAQCLDLMGFRIWKETITRAVKGCSIFAVCVMSEKRSQTSPSRYCRICSGPGCLSLPAPQWSAGRKQETKAGGVFKKRSRQRHGRKMNEVVRNSSCQGLFGTTTKDLLTAEDFQLSEHSGGRVEQKLTGFTVEFWRFVSVFFISSAQISLFSPSVFLSVCFTALHT